MTKSFLINMEDMNKNQFLIPQNKIQSKIEKESLAWIQLRTSKLVIQGIDLDSLF